MTTTAYQFSNIIIAKMRKIINNKCGMTSFVLLYFIVDRALLKHFYLLICFKVFFRKVLLFFYFYCFKLVEKKRLS